MDKYSVFSITSLVIWILLLFTMGATYKLPLIGIRIIVFLMFLIPLLGIIFGFKSQKGFMKWLLIILNFIAVSFILIPVVLIGVFGVFPTQQ